MSAIRKEIRRPMHARRRPAARRMLGRRPAGAQAPPASDVDDSACSASSSSVMIMPGRRPGPAHTGAGRGPRRPVIGTALGLIGVVHVAATAVFYPSSVTSILDGGVFAAVEADPELVPLRGLGFWYVTSGLGVIALGVTVADLERRHLLRPHHGALLGAIGLWGVLLAPKSGFWLFLPLAALTALTAIPIDAGSAAPDPVQATGRQGAR